MKRLILYTLTVLLIVAVLVGFVQLYQNYALQSSTVEQQPKSQKVYFADHISPAHEAVIKRFNELHAGKIEVIPVNLPAGDFLKPYSHSAHHT